MAQKVLVVEDEQALRDALSLKLKKEGFTVFEAKNGDEGLNSAKTDHPDIILLDIMMPETNGLDVLQELKSNVGLMQIPVLVLTNLPEASAEQKAMKLGATEYLVKSNSPLEVLVEKIKSHLKKSAAEPKFRGTK